MGLSRSSAVAMVMAATFIWGLAMKPMSEAANDCGSLLVSLSGCQTFLKDPSSTPDQKGCCQPLQTVLSSSGGIQCICALDTGAGTQSAQYKNALRIPDACKLGVNVSATNCSSITRMISATLCCHFIFLW
ncbi:hypothetical protein KP509_04G032800 [Ceratopteris richardii]|uniref:Bifunctional inhibitor/plant lipid transfer protein/seed storage helical domain-containing protein n=1 Tax=Ceratopteris richardii TaxID=49495 RepID=A0A8T2UYR3_CERRI|nr:hypothetical protein KP509_04G032800 [Ceratopteris richardii]